MRRDELIGNAKKLRELHSRLNKEFEKGPHGIAHHAACAEFHRLYDSLAFPGGYDNQLIRLESGEPDAIDAALMFLEVRPYFFQSQYIMKKLSRLLGHAPLSPEQALRYSEIKKKKGA